MIKVSGKTRAQNLGMKVSASELLLKLCIGKIDLLRHIKASKVDAERYMIRT